MIFDNVSFNIISKHCFLKTVNRQSPQICLISTTCQCCYSLDNYDMDIVI
jgi:hypothetical protein